jgi:hypothetical protein
MKMLGKFSPTPKEDTTGFLNKVISKAKVISLPDLGTNAQTINKP